MMSEKKFKVGDRVSLKQAVDVHIDGGLTQICPGEVGIIDWTNGKEMEVHFGDYVRLVLYASQVERVEPTNPRTAFLQELKELLSKHNADIWADGGWDWCSLHLELGNRREKYNVKGGNLTHNEPIELEDYSEY